MTGRLRWHHVVSLLVAFVLAGSALLLLAGATADGDDATRDREHEAAALRDQRLAANEEADAWAAQKLETTTSLKNMQAAIETGQQIVALTDQLVDNARATQQAGSTGNLDELRMLSDRRNELVAQMKPLLDAWSFEMVKVNRPEYDN